MMATHGFENGHCALCQQYGLQVIAARTRAAQLAGRASRAEARLAGGDASWVHALQQEASRLKDSARVSEQWLVEHRAEMHTATASAAA